MNFDTQSIKLDAPRFSEREITAAQNTLLDKFGDDAVVCQSRGGASPYSPETIVVANGPSTLERGTQVTLVPVGRSHDGADNYKGRGRWLTLVAISDQPGEWAICEAEDRGALRVGCTSIFVRPWTMHKEEEAAGGLGPEAAGQMAAAFEALGF